MKNSMIGLIMVFNLNAICQSNVNLQTIDSLVNRIDKIKLTYIDSFIEEDTLSRAKLNITLFRYFNENKLFKCVRESKATKATNCPDIHTEASYTYYYNDNKLIKVVGKVHEKGDEIDTQIYFNNEAAFDYFLTVNGKKIQKPYFNSFIIFVMDSKFILQKFGTYVTK